MRIGDRSLRKFPPGQKGQRRGDGKNEQEYRRFVSHGVARPAHTKPQVNSGAGKPCRQEVQCCLSSVSESVPSQEKYGEQKEAQHHNVKGVHGFFPPERNCTVISRENAPGAQFQTRFSPKLPHSTSATSLLLRVRRPCQARGPARLLR